MRPEELGDRTDLSPFNSFSALTGAQTPWRQLESALQLTRLFRETLSHK